MFTLLAGNDWFHPHLNRMLPIAVWELLVDFLDYSRRVDARGHNCLEQVRALGKHKVSDVHPTSSTSTDTTRLDGLVVLSSSQASSSASSGESAEMSTASVNVTEYTIND
jgi:hypothetical protein